MAQNDAPTHISCRDNCGAKVPVELQDSSGWERGAITNRLRCPACVKALRDADIPPDSVAEFPRDYPTY